MKRRFSVLILEDEKSAANQLKIALDDINNFDFAILEVIETVRDTIRWLKINQAPDLIFMDIQLADGLSLDLFNKVSMPCPVIFCTAYDQYAIEAFHTNAVDYLLKPIDNSKLQRAIESFCSQFELFSQQIQFDQIQSVLTRIDKPQYRSSFLIHSKQKMVLIKISEVSYFSLSARKVKLTTKDGSMFPVDMSLEQVYQQLDPIEFLRANRQMIISKSAVQSIEQYGLGKLAVELNPPYSERVIISKEKVSAFKQWANS